MKKILLLLTLTIVSFNSFSIEFRCIGNNIIFKGQSRSADSTHYWENITINKNILLVPKYGKFKRRSVDSLYWLNGDNWVKLNPNTGKFTLSVQKNNYVKRQIQAKCSDIQKKLF
jgi:hypothetical protein